MVTALRKVNNFISSGDEEEEEDDDDEEEDEEEGGSESEEEAQGRRSRDLLADSESEGEDISAILGNHRSNYEQRKSRVRDKVEILREVSNIP